MIRKVSGAITPVAITVLGIIPSSAQEQDRPNIVCVVSEDNSMEYLQLYGRDKGAVAPNIEWMAEEGVLFENAYSAAPVSSAARSTLISGIYGPRMGSHYHRRELDVEMPYDMKMFPAYLRQAGYYTANNAKEDYNIVLGDDVWDESSKKASWSKRKEGQPFYYVHNFEDTHEGQVMNEPKMRKEVEGYEPKNGVHIQPNYPDTELFRLQYKFYCKRLEDVDRKIGKILDKLKAENLLDNTIILYYGDNGGVLPHSKGYLTDMGVRVPLVAYVPAKYRQKFGVIAGGRDNRFVSFLDLAPTILDMAGVKAPKQMDGESIWKKKEDCDKVFCYADRMGEKYDMVRSVRIGNFKYIRSFEPFNFEALTNGYRAALPVYKELTKLYKQSKLNELQSQFFKPKQAEMLFDLSSDPYELHNLAEQKDMQQILKQMRHEMTKWQLDINDIGLLPEYYWIREAGSNTVEYTENHKARIKRLLKIANLEVEDNFAKIETKVIKALQSEDELERYWALIVCCSFNKEAKSLLPMIQEIATYDKEAVNRARAAQYIALCNFGDSNPEMLQALYSTSDPREATLILNMMTMLWEGETKVDYTIDTKRLAPEVLANTLVKSAIKKHQK